MKKIKLIFAFLAFVFFANAEIYLVQPGGSGASWDAGVTGTVVDLSTPSIMSLDEWYASASVSEDFDADDEIWLIKGTYALTGTLTTQSTEKIYGGFAGTEQAVDERTMGANAWNFTNETVLIGGYFMAIESTTGATIDGISVQGCNYTAGDAMAAVKITTSSILQNSIVRNNTVTGLSANNYSGGVYVSTNAKLLNSYIHNNVCNSTDGGGNGGGVILEHQATVDGCTITKNTSNRAGGGMHVIARTGGAVINNCVISDNTATTGVAGGLNLTGGDNYDFATGKNVTISNCTISSNKALAREGGGLYLDVPNASPTSWNYNPVYIKNCIVSSNTTTSSASYPARGGGFYLSRGAYSISDCTISYNEVHNSGSYINENNGGGAIFAYGGATDAVGSSLTMTNSIVKGNVLTAGTKGSFIRSEYASIIIKNSLITGNVGDNFLQQGLSRVCNFQNCTIDGNGKGMYLGYGVKGSGDALNKFTNTIFYNSGSNPIGGYFSNSGYEPTISNCAFGTDATSATTSTVQYAKMTNCINTITAADFTDAANGDFTLAVGSAAINAGATIAEITHDLLGTVRPQGGAYDIGAYEYLPTIDVCTWRSEAEDNDWRNPNNWVDGDEEPVNAIPSKNAVVTIQEQTGVTKYYPILAKETTVNSIIFKSGAELGNQHLLNVGSTINATVNFDVFAEKARWTLLSLPVTNAVFASNFHFKTDATDAAKPYTWVMKFLPNGDVAGWDFLDNTATLPGLGKGFAISIGEGIDPDDEDIVIAWDDDCPAYITGKLNADATVEVPLSFTKDGSGNSNLFALVGNPFMTSIDFSSLYTNNSDRIKNYYMVWTMVSEDEGFAGHYGGEGNEFDFGITGVNNSEAKYISPLQAFFVEQADDYDSDTDGENLVLDVTSISGSTIIGQGSLRSATSDNYGKLDIIAANGTVPVKTFISDKAGMTSARKLKNGCGDIPDIYIHCQPTKPMRSTHSLSIRTISAFPLLSQQEKQET